MKLKHHTLWKGIYSGAVTDGRIDNREAKKVFKILEDIDGSKINYSKLVYRSGDNKYFNFAVFRSLLKVDEQKYWH